MKIFGVEYINPPSDIEIIKTAKSKKNTHSSNTSVTKTKESKWEIDLHIEHLLDSHNGLSNTEILLKQLTHFRSTFSKAKSQTPEIVEWVTAPPNSSEVTSSCVTVLTTSGPVTNIYELSFTMKIKSVNAGEYTAPPADGPMIKEICGITPEAVTLRWNISA